MSSDLLIVRPISPHMGRTIDQERDVDGEYVPQDGGDEEGRRQRFAPAVASDPGRHDQGQNQDTVAVVSDRIK